MSITQDRVRELLHYDPETGLFRWRVDRNGQCRQGGIAGRRHCQGYIAITVDRRTYLAHRLVWLYEYGTWPPRIDHRDTDKTNNRIANLRPATGQQNGFNRAAPKHNTSGVKGVSWCARTGKWRAHITPDRKFRCLGRFDRLEDAIAARSVAASLIAGEFARQ